MKQQSWVLCEGYHDRAFWAGWLNFMGCSDEGFRPGTKGFPALDPWNGKVVQGHLGFHSPGGQFIRVVSCRGRANILREVRSRLKQRNTHPLRRLVINVDADEDVGAGPTGSAGLKSGDVLYLVKEFDPSAAINPEQEIEMDGGATKLSLIRWEVTDPAAEGIPDQQSLERLVCAALVAAYPERAKLVHDWLRSRPPPALAGPKEFAWSHMAGWYADHGCEDFFSNAWRDSRVDNELKTRLGQSTAWRITEMLIG